MIFRYDYKGRPIYYPWGILGKGYILPDESEKIRISRYVKVFNIIGMSIAFIGSLISFVFFILFFPIFIIFHYLIISRLIKNYPVSALDLTYYESLKLNAQGSSKKLLWFLVILSLFMVIFSIGALFMKPDNPFIAFTGIVLFGFCAFIFYMMLKMKEDDDKL